MRSIDFICNEHKNGSKFNFSLGIFQFSQSQKHGKKQHIRHWHRRHRRRRYHYTIFIGVAGIAERISYHCDKRKEHLSSLTMYEMRLLASQQQLKMKMQTDKKTKKERISTTLTLNKCQISVSVCVLCVDFSRPCVRFFLLFSFRFMFSLSECINVYHICNDECSPHWH